MKKTLLIVMLVCSALQVEKVKAKGEWQQAPEQSYSSKFSGESNVAAPKEQTPTLGCDEAKNIYEETKTTFLQAKQYRDNALNAYYQAMESSKQAYQLLMESGKGDTKAEKAQKQAEQALSDHPKNAGIEELKQAEENFHEAARQAIQAGWDKAMTRCPRDY